MGGAGYAVGTAGYAVGAAGYALPGTHAKVGGFRAAGYPAEVGAAGYAPSTLCRQ